MKKKDGRRNNGRTAGPNGEDKQLVRGPKVLIEAMRQRAALEGRPVVAIWREAAVRLLNG